MRPSALLKLLNQSSKERRIKINGIYVDIDNLSFSESTIQDGLIPVDKHIVFDPFEAILDESILSGYTTTVYGNKVTETLVGFTGLLNESPSLLPISPLIEYFVGPKEFFFPAFSSNTNDLFIGIDLGDWLTADITVEPLQTFDFIDGLNEELPGVFVALTPVIPTSNGFTAVSPYTGSVISEGTLDGGITTPESSSLLGLITLGTIGVGMNIKRK